MTPRARTPPPPFRCWRAGKPSGSGRGCTWARLVSPGCTTRCSRCPTGRSTRYSPVAPNTSTSRWNPTAACGSPSTGQGHGRNGSTPFARERQLLTRTDTDLGADRLCGGLTAVVSARLDRPEFEGATRDFLGNAEVRESVAPAVRERLIAWLAEDPRLASAVIGRIAAGTSSAGA
ncbi:hypothetical protein ACFYVK_32060 [Streptomyces chartreusis]|uniref:hypothetical protein n=1 Tax=Streptomyces chartreusis TaxID=1969 RepID=UPI0036B93874